ncbi:hypothetical protein K523DRAFT_420918 [Schizophyllum commune Tattone D]|nr:hypothetical protein K523DRAFT_420918 [Schizophyllum commune Tattone D]
MEASVVYRPLAADYVNSLQYISMQIALVFVFYGAQAALSIASISVLVRREGSSPILLLATLTSIFLFSSIAAVVDISYYLIYLPVGYGTVPHEVTRGILSRINIVGTVAERWNYVMSDAIVVWRAWVLWPESRLARGALLTCMCGSVVGTILETVWSLQAHSAHLNISPSRALAMPIPLLITNAVATALVGVKVWSYRRDIKRHLALGTRKSQVEKVLLILLESGFVYCLVWVLYLLAENITGTAAYSLTPVIGVVIPSLAGIYPAFVVLAAVQGRSTDMLSMSDTQISHAMRFAGSELNDTPSVGESHIQGIEEEFHRVSSVLTANASQSERTGCVEGAS